MPAGYDPGKITRDDATNDSAICGATEELSALRAESKKTSSMARETVDDVTDEELSELAAIDEEWGDAVRALRDIGYRVVAQTLFPSHRHGIGDKPLVQIDRDGQTSIGPLLDCSRGRQWRTEAGKKRGFTEFQGVTVTWEEA